MSCEGIGSFCKNLFIVFNGIIIWISLSYVIILTSNMNDNKKFIKLMKNNTDIERELLYNPICLHISVVVIFLFILYKSFSAYTIAIAKWTIEEYKKAVERVLERNANTILASDIEEPLIDG